MRVVASLLLLSIPALTTANKTEICLFKCKGFIEKELCVTPKNKCNDFPDCYEGEDEKGCDCEEFCASDRSCFKSDQKCDGQIDCLDGTDEKLCSKELYRKQRPNLPLKDLCLKPCAPNGSCKFMANDVAVCICDPGYIGDFCRQAEAPENVSSPVEAPAKTKVFKCLQGGKIDEQLLCNGVPDCPDKSDEFECTREDYRRSSPKLADDQLCLMPCKAPASRCQFDSDGKASCSCPSGFGGKLCEQQLTGSSTTASATTDRGHNEHTDDRVKPNASPANTATKVTNDDSRNSSNMIILLTSVGLVLGGVFV